MNVLRMAVGVALFLVSSWISPYIGEVLGIPESIAFLTVGGMLAFMGGMIFYSGVKACRLSYRF